MWDAGWFYQDNASRVNAKPQKIYQYFVRLNRKVGRKNNNISKNHLSTVYLKSNEKIKCPTSEYNDNIKSLKCGRIVPPSRWDGPDGLPKEVRSEHDKTYELFLSMRTMKSLHFRSVVRKVPV